MRHVVKRAIKKAFHEIAVEQGIKKIKTEPFEISIPKDEKFGHFSSNLAMVKASLLQRSPKEIANMLEKKLIQNELFESVESAGPGFLNIRIKPDFWVEHMNEIFTSGKSYGRVQVGHDEKVIVEFVSANPTGPLHIGHGRGAVIGDALARILDYAGYKVHTEYYINDIGLQMENLGRSILVRLSELKGEVLKEQPPYKGNYITEIANEYKNSQGKTLVNEDDENVISDAARFAAENILKGITSDLNEFGISFNKWYPESWLHANNKIEQAIEMLTRSGQIYNRDGALWIKTDSQGDEKDRVVKRANGINTYLAADIAYHKSKIDRGFTKFINIWGADHHGYVPRMRAVMVALGENPDNMIVRLVQLVSLKKDGEGIAMSTRDGVFTTLREIMDEVGVDATRFFFLMRSSDNNNNPKVIVGRLKNAYKNTIPQAIEFANKQIGVDYDEVFILDNDKYYCSELIYEAFSKDSIFQLRPMTFLHPETKDTLSTWKEYYSDLGVEIPQNKLGINPGIMSLSEKIEIIHFYGIPDGMKK